MLFSNGGTTLTATESAKTTNFFYNYTDLTFSFTSLTAGNYYRMCIWSHNYDTNARYGVIQDITYSASIGPITCHAGNLYGANTGNITTYVFCANYGIQTRAFKLTNTSGGSHIYMITLENLGKSVF